MKTILMQSTISEASVSELMTLCEQAVAAGETEIRIIIASDGGDIRQAFRGFYFLSTLPVVLHTHNCGYVDSAAVLLFLAGTVRSATAEASFFLHSLECTFEKSTTISHDQMRNILIRLDSDYQRITSLFQAQTLDHNSSVKWPDVLNSLSAIDAELALQYGLIDIIKVYLPEQQDILGVII